MLRIARGRAWTRETNANLTSRSNGPLRFAVPSSNTDGTQTYAGSGDKVMTMSLRNKASTVDVKPEAHV